MKFDDRFPKELPQVGDLIRVAYQGEPGEGICIVEADVTARTYNCEEFAVNLKGAGMLLSANLEGGILKWRYAEADHGVSREPSPQIYAVKVIYSPWVKN